jgi:hypothetical protein
VIEKGRFLGEEFIVWLWMRGLNDGGVSGKKDDLSACFIDDDVTMTYEHGDVKEICLKRGNPQESREAFEALSRGMRPCKAKVRILDGDMEWVFMLGAANLELSALKVPPSDSKDIQGRLGDRLFGISECVKHIENRFAIFLAERVKDFPKMAEDVKGWISNVLE